DHVDDEAGIDPNARASLEYAPLTDQLGGPQSVSTALNKNQTITIQHNFTNPARATPIVADVNGDGVPDVLIVTGAGQIRLRLGLPGQPGAYGSALILNDVNHDPVRQIALVDHQPSHVEIAGVGLGAGRLYVFSAAGVAAGQPYAGFQPAFSASLGNYTLPARLAAGDLEI